MVRRYQSGVSNCPISTTPTSPTTSNSTAMAVAVAMAQALLGNHASGLEDEHLVSAEGMLEGDQIMTEDDPEAEHVH
jgi:hypothetical protein